MKASGPTILDSKGLAPGRSSAAPSASRGAISPGTAIGFNGTSDSGSIPLNLSGTHELTVEFWLKWNSYANNDALAMEFTPNFNENSGGFIVDPNSGEFGGTFGIGVGNASDRNSVFFTRPSAGVWHHYAIVINTAAAPGSEITPYVDGNPVSYQQESAAGGQGNFANSSLYLMSRDGSSLFGAGTLDELAIYNQDLSATTVFSHYHAKGVNLTLTPSLSVSPSPAVTGQNVTLEGSGSTDTAGTITDYRWDLDNSGTYSTDTGSTPKLVHAFTSPGSYLIGLQTTDSNGTVARTTHVLTVTQAPPATPVLTLSGATGSTYISGTNVYTDPQAGNSGSFTLAAATSDPSGIKNVTFPTLAGYSSGGGVLTSSPYQTTYAWTGAGGATGPETVTATNNESISASSTFNVIADTTPPSGGALTVNGKEASAAGTTSYNITGHYEIPIRTEYAEGQSATASGLRSSTLTVAAATLANNVCSSFGTPSTITGAPAQSEPTGCYRYTLTGTDNVGNQASVSTTVIVDTSAPSTPALTFSGLSSNTYYKTSTNALYFRPSAGGTFTVAAASTDPDTGIKSYSFSPLSSNGFTEAQNGGTVSYTFGESATQPATAPTITAASNAGATSAAATYSLIADTTGPTGGGLTVNNTVVPSYGAITYSTTGTFSIVRTDYNADAGSGLASSILTLRTGTISKGTCLNFGNPTTLSGAPAQNNLPEGCYLYTLTGTDRVGNTSSLATVVIVDRTPPTATLSAPANTNTSVPLTFSASDNGSGLNTATTSLQRASATLTTSNNTCSFFTPFAPIGSAGLASPFTDTTVTSGKCYEYEYVVSDLAGNRTTSAVATVHVNTTKPALTGITDTTPGSVPGAAQVGDAITLTFSDQIEAASIPATLKLTYSRPLIGSTTLTSTGLTSGSWSTGDAGTAKYANFGGTAPVLTVSTAVSGNTVKLTITSISDPSHELTPGGPGVVTGTLAATIKDIYGNTASTSSFTTASVRLF